MELVEIRDKGQASAVVDKIELVAASGKMADGPASATLEKGDDGQALAVEKMGGGMTSLALERTVGKQTSVEAEKRGGGEGHGEKWLNGGGAARGARYTHPSLAMSEKCSHFIPKTINTRSNGGFYNKRRLINLINVTK